MIPADLPLFSWSPPRKVIMFPMNRRAGRIRSTATKLLDKPTERAAASYRNQVTDALLRSFDRAGIPEAEQDEQLGAFWQAVEAEVVRQTYCGHGTGGAA